MTYADMAARAQRDTAYRDGLLDAVQIARAQGGSPDTPPCPADMVAVYIENVANGQEP